MSDDPNVKPFRSGADIARQNTETAAEVDVRARCVSMAIQAGVGKDWAPDAYEKAAESFYRFMTKRG